MDLWCNCEKQEYQEFFIPKDNSDLQNQHDQCECWSIAKRDIFELVLNIFTHHLAVNIHMEDKCIPNFKIHKNLIQSKRNKLIPDNASNLIYIPGESE